MQFPIIFIASTNSLYFGPRARPPILQAPLGAYTESQVVVHKDSRFVLVIIDASEFWCPNGNIDTYLLLTYSDDGKYFLLPCDKGKKVVTVSPEGPYYCDSL
jgi:hypothetical protein